MSISAVMDRIQAIEAQVAQLSRLGNSRATDASGFAGQLEDALSATAPTAMASVSSASGVGTAGRIAANSGTGLNVTQQRVIAAAESALGLDYVWGGNSLTTGVDCSGLVQQAFRTVGIELPRLSADQARSGTAVSSLAEAKPGDLIAWDNSSRNNGADHIAIYLGDGKMIEAPYRGAQVRITDVPSTPDYIRRVIPDALPASAGATSLATARGAFDLQALFSEIS